MAANEYGEELNSNGYAPSVFPEDQCYFEADKRTTCDGTGDLVFHEVYHFDKAGIMRSMAKRYGAWVTLCPLHHGMVHSFPQFGRELQQETQRRVMERYDWTTDDFRKHFAKNYL